MKFAPYLCLSIAILICGTGCWSKTPDNSNPQAAEDSKPLSVGQPANETATADVGGSSEPQTAVDLTADDVVGDYRLTDVREMGSGFQLNDDGTYKFYLAYGNVDEFDTGTWEKDGAFIVLKSSAPNSNPSFTFVSSSRQPIDGVTIQFEGTGARVAPYCARVLISSGGRQVDADPVTDGTLSNTEVKLPVQNIRMQLSGVLRNYPAVNFAPKDPGHNHFVISVEKGNYGTARFDGTKLQIAQRDLILSLPHGRFRYVRSSPKPTSTSSIEITPLEIVGVRF